MHYLGNNCVERILSNECLVESLKLICLVSFLYAYAQYFKIKLDQHYEFSWVMVEQLNKKKKVALKNNKNVNYKGTRNSLGANKNSSLLVKIRVICLFRISQI